jgi:hypothetical protein
MIDYCKEKGSQAEQEFQAIIEGDHVLKLVSPPGPGRQELVFSNCVQYERQANPQEDRCKHFDCVIRFEMNNTVRSFTVDVKSQKCDYMGKGESKNILLEVHGHSRMPGWISGGESQIIFFKYNNVFYGFPRQQLKAYIAPYKLQKPIYQSSGEREQDVVYTRNWPQSSRPKNDGFMYVDPERLKSVMSYFVLERC